MEGGRVPLTRVHVNSGSGSPLAEHDSVAFCPDDVIMTSSGCWVIVGGVGVAVAKQSYNEYIHYEQH